MGKRRNCFKNKKGISNVIAALIMVVISIVAITIVWGVLRNTITEESSKISISQLSLDLAIKAAYVDGSNIVVGVRRSPGGGEIIGVNFVFNDGTESVSVKKMIALNELEARNFIFPSLEIPGISAGDLVLISPIYELGGEEKIGIPTDSSKIGSTGQGGGSEPSTCGDGSIGSGEQCDDNNALDSDGCSSTCQIELGYTCAGEPSICTLGVVCGDGLIGFGEGCDDNNALDGDGCSSTCQVEADYTCIGIPSVCTLGVVCGDGLIGSGEGCDDNNQLDGDGCSSTCQVEADYTCLGEPSACTPDGSCDGVWNPGAEDPEVVCDGGTGCQPSCTCLTSYIADNLGGCIKEPSVNDGIINSVWPSGAIKYIDSSDLPIDDLIIQSYIGKYVNFSSVAGCFKISYAEYLPEYITSYIRTEIVMIGIALGDGYEIWTSNTCGA